VIYLEKLEDKVAGVVKKISIIEHPKNDILISEYRTVVPSNSNIVA
jgi:hypothetical protein